LPLSLLGILAFAGPALALGTPPEVAALSSAGTPVGQALRDANGQPYLDAQGNPITVLDSQTTAGNATPISISNALLVPLGDLMGYAASVGISPIPLMMTGTITTVTRSDGGIERIFDYAAANGDHLVFMADQTGPNIYGIRIADVHPNGQGQVLTAHGLNGNFTNPPWWLTAQARAQYYLTNQLAQVLPDPGNQNNPPTSNPSGPTLASSGRAQHGRMNYTSNLSIGNASVRLSSSRLTSARTSVAR